MFLFRFVWRVVGFGVKAVVFVAALAAVAGGVMYALFDGEQYKKALSQRVVDVTGRVLTIDGPAELQLTLPPRLVLNNVRISNPRSASRRDMARIRRVEIDLNPLSAISGNSSLAQIRADGADIMLETGQLGADSNWQNFAIGGAAQAVVAALGFGIFAPPVGLPPVTLSNSTLTVQDAAGGVQSISLGAASLQVAGSSAPPVFGAPLLAAAGPCETEEQQRSNAEQQRSTAEQPRRR